MHSKQLQWVPQGSQSTRFSAPDSQPRPSYDDIVIAKLRPGQSIEAELHVEKGLGQQHAKWSPVSTASYRLLPEVLLTEPIVDAAAEALKSKCPMNVFDIEDIAAGAQHSGAGGLRRATVARPRNCTMCRECTRGDMPTTGAPWSERIKLRRVRDHFIFSVETTGAYSPSQVVREAIGVLKEKASTLKRLFKGHKQGEEDDQQEEAKAKEQAEDESDDE